MTRLQQAKKQQEVEKVKRSVSQGEQLAIELNVVLRTAHYSDPAARRAAIERAKRRVGREWWDVLMGRIGK